MYLKKAAVAIVLWLGSGLVTDAASPTPAPAGASESVTVHVASGDLAGRVRDGIATYLGVPYAAPPVGDLRWRAPAPAPAWTGVRDASDFGASCMQSELPSFTPPGSRAATMSEDCLTLNVWTQAAGPQRRPVMVWLHGGGNIAGSGSSTYSNGIAFARDGIVLVSLNYRLGVVGFFAHRALVAEAGAGDTANFGLLDQIAALRWVRANIAAFGGDPANVTLFGESAGGEDAVLLAASPAATGLFARAIAESPADMWFRRPSLVRAEERSAAIATGLGLSGASASATQLRALPATALAKVNYEEQLGPIVDGRVLTADIVTELAHGSRVPLVIGTNADDGSVIGDYNDMRILFDDVRAQDLAAVQARYRARGVPEVAVAHRLFTDSHFEVPARWIAARTAAAGVPAYLYRFDYVASFLANRRPAASHGSEIPFVFASFPAQWLTATDTAVQEAMHGCWVAFARTGTPVCPSAPPWPAYDKHGGRVMDFASTPSVIDPGDDDVLDTLEPDFLTR
jgi:para-nitrobenzyl esterase